MTPPELALHAAAKSPGNGSQQKPSLVRLPTEVKNQIFSYFLLARNVKRFTDGRPPGYTYDFDTNIMLVNKQLHHDADYYLRTHNEFALIHIKFFHFRTTMVPSIATGRKARAFTNPTIEATFQHTDSTCLCPFRPNGCDQEKHRTKCKASRVLLLVDDLHHFIRQLQQAYHVWPSKPIYVLRSRNARPVEYSTARIHTPMTVVWKVNKDHHLTLSSTESRTRQQRLLASVEALVNSGQKITLCGVDENIATRTMRTMTPRVVSLDAVGWDLLELMQHQKQYLDELVSQGCQDPAYLIDAYLSTSQLGRDSTLWARFRPEHNTAFIFSSIYNRGQATPLALLFAKDKERVNPVTESWLYGVALTSLECLFNAMSLALDSRSWMYLTAQNCSTLATLFSGNPNCSHKMPAHMTVLAAHYSSCSWVFRALSQDTMLQRSLYDDICHLEGDLQRFPNDEYMRQDLEYMKKLDKTKPGLSNDWSQIFPGLRSRERFFNTPMKLKRPEDLGGWTVPGITPELEKDIIEHAESAIQTGRMPNASKTRRLGHVMYHLYNGPESDPPQYNTITFNGMYIDLLN